MSLADQLEKAGIEPRDLVIIGAALSAAAASMLLAKEALSQIEGRKQKREYTPEQRVMMLQALGPTIEVLGKMPGDFTEGVSEIVKEALVFGSILPDEIG